jgi:hypothetical protein
MATRWASICLHCATSWFSSVNQRRLLRRLVLLQVGLGRELLLQKCVDLVLLIVQRRIGLVELRAFQTELVEQLAV